MAENEQYTVIGQTYVNKWQEDIQRAVAGVEITVRDAQTGTVIPVFVPRDKYGPDQAKALILHELALVRSVADTAH